MPYLGMQVLIEGLALAAFGVQRDVAANPLVKQLLAYVMQDEARHVAFGRLALRDYYAQLSSAELADREEFVVEGCYLMRDRFVAREVYERLGFDVAECVEFTEHSPVQQAFRKLLFTRIVPCVKDIGLWGPKVQQAYVNLGVLDAADSDLDALMLDDEQVADRMEREHAAELAARKVEVEAAIASGAVELRPFAERIERATALDGPVRALSRAVVRALPPSRAVDLLHGVPFGQPAHPALVRLPIGCWTSAVLLDLAGRPRTRGRAGVGHADRGGRGGGAARRRHRPRRLVGAAHPPAAGRAGARDRAGRRDPAVRAARCSPGRPGGAAAAPRWRPAGSPPPPSAATSAVTWRCGSAPDRATPSRSGTWPRSAGRISARWPSCRRGGPPDASSATSACSRCAPARPSTCSPTSAPTSAGRCTRAAW